MRATPTVSLLALALAFALPGCDRAPEATTVPAVASTQSADAAWQAAVDGFMAGWYERNPVAAANAGKHEYDGKLPDWSPEGLAADAGWLKAERDRLAAIDPATLGARGAFQREYVLSVIDGQLFWLVEADFPHRNPAFYAGDISPSMYLTRDYAPLRERMAAFVAYQEALPKAAAQIRANLGGAPLPASYIDYGAGVYGGLADFFVGDVPAIFAQVDDPALQERFRASNAAAAKAMRELADWLQQGKATATQDFALGPERFARMLQATERVDVPLAELKAAGEADLARNLAALGKACAAFAPGLALVDCVARMNANKSEGGAVEGARAQLGDLKRFLVDKDLVTIPGPEEALVAEAPPFNRWNFAYIEIPGPYEKALPSTYYIAPPDPSWPQADQDAYVPGAAKLLFTSAHEVWPGHFLHFLHANRSEWKFAQQFVGYAFAEGWAHYTEEMMFDAGLGGATPEVHVGLLSSALLRNVRFLSAIGLHTGGMTVAQSEAMFREQGLQDPGNARQQAARGTYDPAYLNYTLGKLMIMRLREDWTADHGGRQGWKAFHDAFLSYGGPPIPLVRAQMLGGAVEAKLWTAPAADVAASPSTTAPD
jgi:hypothetical protein